MGDGGDQRRTLSQKRGGGKNIREKMQNEESSEHRAKHRPLRDRNKKPQRKLDDSTPTTGEGKLESGTVVDEERELSIIACEGLPFGLLWASSGVEGGYRHTERDSNPSVESLSARGKKKWNGDVPPRRREKQT